MTRRTRDRSRGFSPGLDPLEGRRLLSGPDVTATAPPAEVTDADDARGTSAALAVPLGQDEKSAPATAGHAPSEPTDEILADRSDADHPDADGPRESGPAVGPEVSARSAEVAGPIPLGQEMNPTAVRGNGTVPRFDLSPPDPSASASYPPLTNDPEPTTSPSHEAAGADAASSPSAPWLSEGDTEEARIPSNGTDLGVETTAGPKAEPSPTGAGLIARASPFSGELLTKAVDDVLDHFEDLGVLDGDGTIVARQFAAIGAACLSTLGAIELFRRLGPKDFEGDRKRTPSVAMIPALRPTR